VLRDGGPADWQSFGELPDGQGAFAEPVEEDLSGGIAEGGEEARLVSYHLR
jgi:hypothetical protein